MTNSLDAMQGMMVGISNGRKTIVRLPEKVERNLCSGGTNAVQPPSRLSIPDSVRRTVVCAERRNDRSRAGKAQGGDQVRLGVQ